ncbi:hypothetical protein TSOC_014222 [Tetrabaena socialis]|uniref:Uncharacterized protein n=1 Tax=Tetrabaena socialis TaxID=47790 RepID=A0A2J7ZI81_9CHLO|nr:hypothetical protein TSOC_014222 [Tetrabaena socialis]|eukprot:PNG99980.1 hypothetical protein TSOC_014222 [Tetrabaena socialis]
MSPLNPNAAEFVPSSRQFYYDPACCYDPSFEEHVTSEELEELEACEEWVALQAELEESEREHLIAMALMEADPRQILEVEVRALALGADGNSSSKRKTEIKRKGRH